MHKILEKMPLCTQFTQTLRDPCKILVHDIKNPFDYKCSIDAQLPAIEWAMFYRKSGDTLVFNFLTGLQDQMRSRAFKRAGQTQRTRVPDVWQEYLPHSNLVHRLDRHDQS